MDTLTIISGKIKLQAHSFDNDKELEICLLDSSDNTLGLLFISPNQANELVTHLVGQLSNIKEPINALKP